MTEVSKGLSESPERKQPPYRTIEELLAEIPGRNGKACRRILKDHRERFTVAPGSKQKHQAWAGGYLDHVTDAMNIGSAMYDLWSSTGRDLGFERSDVLLILFLHDIEKPFKYYIDDENHITDVLVMSKPMRAEFRLRFMADYGIELNTTQDNALKHAEGVRDEVYNQHERQMWELATLCHQADEASAYLFFDYPKAADDPWEGAKRANSRAASVIIRSETVS